MDETKNEPGPGTAGGDEELQPIIIHPEIQGDGRPFGEPELERRVQRRRSTDVDMSVIPAGRLAADGESYSPPELSAGETKRDVFDLAIVPVGSPSVGSFPGIGSTGIALPPSTYSFEGDYGGTFAPDITRIMNQ